MNRSSRLHSTKKGNIVLDALLIIVVLFACLVIAIFAFKSMDEINTKIQARNDISSQAKSLLADNTSKAPSVFDGMFVTVFVLLWALLLIGSYNIKTSPAIFALFLIMFAAIIFVGMLLANAADDISNDSQLSTIAQSMPKMLFIMDNFALVLVFVIASVALAVWGKNVFDRNPY